MRRTPVLVLAVLLAAPAVRAADAAKLVQVQGFGGPRTGVAPKLARSSAYAAAVALALYELAERAHAVTRDPSAPAKHSEQESDPVKYSTDFAFPHGLRISGWVARSQALDKGSDLKVTLPKMGVWTAAQELRVADSALAEPAPEKVSASRLKWTLRAAGIKIRKVEYSDDNWATVTLEIDHAKLDKLASAAKP